MTPKQKCNLYLENILQESKSLPVHDLKEIMDFVWFIKLRSATDPSQAYFWTKEWQKAEKGAEEDICKGKVAGPYSSVKELIKNLKK